MKKKHDEGATIAKWQFSLILDELWRLWDDPLTLDEVPDAVEETLELHGVFRAWAKEWVAFQKACAAGGGILASSETEADAVLVKVNQRPDAVQSLAVYFTLRERYLCEYYGPFSWRNRQWRNHWLVRHFLWVSLCWRSIKPVLGFIQRWWLPAMLLFGIGALVGHFWGR